MGCCPISKNKTNSPKKLINKNLEKESISLLEELCKKIFFIYISRK